MKGMIKPMFTRSLRCLTAVLLLLISFVTVAQTLPETDFLKSEIARLNAESPKNDTLIGQYETLLNQITGFDAQRASRDDYRKIISQFPLQRERLLKQIEEADKLDMFKAKQLNSYSDLSQSIASLQAAMSEWRTTSQANAEKTKQLNAARTSLPVSLAQLNQQIEQASLVKSENGAEIDQWLETANLTYLKLQKEVMTAELQSLDERTELVRLEQQLLAKKLQLASPMLIELQDKLTRVEQESVRGLISEARELSAKADESDVEKQRLIEQLRQYTLELEQVLVEIDQARIAGQKFESERRSLSEEQRLIKENLSWLRDSTAFGASIRAQLQRLPNQIQNKTIPDEIANAHIRKYEISQLLDDFALEDAVRATQSNAKTPDRLETLSHELVEQLSQDYEKLIIALGKLQLTINQYAIEVENARAFLREQQLWTRSNVPFWQHLTDFDKEIWFGTKTPLKTLQDEVNPDQIKMVGVAFVFYTLVLFYLGRRLVRRTTRLRHEYKKVFGHPLKDRFQNSISLLFMAMCRAVILPLWYAITAAALFWLWPAPNATESKMLIVASASALFVIELIYAMSSKKGLLELHLNWPERICDYVHKQSNRLRFPFALFLLLIFFAELVAGDQEAEISRLFFLMLMVGMTMVYGALLKSDRIPSTLPVPLNRGLGLLLLKVMILGSFIAIIIMALMGLYIAAWLLLIYQQLTLFVVLGVLFTYQLGERWLKLEHRQLNYQRLLARREELIAQQQEQADEPPEIAELRENFPEVEEQGLGSEQISEQSMTLLRGLSLIGLVIAVLTLWSSALEMTSWLDKVVVWQVSEVVSGSSTLVDVTLQSLIYALITLLVTFVGVRNLPGILELLILRRLELSPGTGYAVTTLLRYLILMTGVLSAFAILGFQWSRLQWLVAAFGVGLGFGLQEIFANFISGLILLFERPIRIGDIVTINDLSGTVSKIQTRATTIIDWDNKEIVVPNKTFITEKLINWSLTDSITRIVIPIGVAYGSDVEKVEELLYQVAEEHPLVLNDPSPSVFFLAFGASSLDFELRVHINSIDHRLSTIHIINKNIDKLFKENDIEIAFPQMDVHVRDWPQDGEKS